MYKTLLDLSNLVFNYRAYPTEVFNLVTGWSHVDNLHRIFLSVGLTLPSHRKDMLSC